MQKMHKLLPASNRNLLVLIKKCVLYTLQQIIFVFFTKIDQFIKIQLGNLIPECEGLFKDILI